MGKQGLRRNNSLPKGRQLDPSALADIRSLLSGRELRRDLLIEFLHLIQDKYGCLQAKHIYALAAEMRLSQVEIYEVASFYDHFDIIKEGEPCPPPHTIRVCDSISCRLAGCESLISELESKSDSSQTRILRAPCMGGCDVAPAARVGNREVGNATAATLLNLIATNNLAPDIPPYKDLSAYQKDGGYAIWNKVKSGSLSTDDILTTLSSSGLRGLGGAGFPTGQKWSIVKEYPAPRLMTINGDEGEPGTFKDRHYLERNPHPMFEGALIGAHVVGAEKCYIYMRDEYPAVLSILAKEITALENSGIVSAGFFELRRGAGAYICGEESAMIESIEGKRGLPRHRPPYIAEVGLFGRPTLNNNIETLYWVPEILTKGVDWFTSQGKEGHKGMRSWSVSGRVNSPGVKLAPAGITAQELIDEHCDGMLTDHTFKAYLPGGASGGILPASLADIPLDFGGRLAELGAFVGSHAIVIFSQKDNISDVALNLIDFFTHESCGQCTPCRLGTQKLGELLRKGGKLNTEAIADLEQVMRDSSICGLGQAAPNPVRHLLEHFPEDLSAKQ